MVGKIIFGLFYFFYVFSEKIVFLSVIGRCVFFVFNVIGNRFSLGVVFGWDRT